MKYNLCYNFIYHNTHKLTAKEYAIKHGLSKSTFSDWLQIFKKDEGQALYHFTEFIRGGQSKLDAVALQETKEFVNERQIGSDAVRTAEFRAFISERAKDTANRRGGVLLDGELNKKTVKRTCESLGCSKRKPQTKTNARIRAEADLRNVVTMASMMMAICEGMSAKLIWNWDATQYEIDHDENIKVITIMSQNAQFVPTVKSKGILSFFVKHYHFHNAAGYRAPPVFVIANDTLDESQHLAYYVEDLGYNDGPAWICFSKTRGGNAAFFNWYMKTIIIPVIVMKRVVRDITVDGELPFAFVYCDGEAGQIAAVEDPEILKIFDSSRIIVGKTPASCSGILQASDVADTFRGIKKYLSSGTNGTPLTEDLRACILDILTDAGISTSEKKKVIVDALDQISNAINACSKKDTVAAGYKRTGQYPLNFNKTLSLVKHKWTNDESNAVQKAKPELIRIMKERGQITEDEMDSLGVPNFNHLRSCTIDNDKRPLSNQRALVLTSQVCRQLHRVRMEEKLKAKELAAQKTPNKRGRKPKNQPSQTSDAQQTPKKRKASSTVPVPSATVQVHAEVLPGEPLPKRTKLVDQSNEIVSAPETCPGTHRSLPPRASKSNFNVLLGYFAK
jgi:transposase